MLNLHPPEVGEKWISVVWALAEVTGNVSFPNGSLGGDSEQSQSWAHLSSWTQVIYLFHSLSHSRDYICLLTPPCPRAPGGQVCFHCSLHLSSFTVPGIHRGGRIEEKSAFSQPQISCLQQNINSLVFKHDTGTMGQNVKLGPSQDTCGASLVAQSVKRICLQCRRPGFNSCLGTPWRRKRQPTPVFLPRESQGQRSLAGYSPWDHKSQTGLSN